MKCWDCRVKAEVANEKASAFLKEIVAVYKKTIDRWGVETQIRQAVEECAEMIGEAGPSQVIRFDKAEQELLPYLYALLRM